MRFGYLSTFDNPLLPLYISSAKIEKLDNLFVIGGGSNNQYWIKLLASILDRDLAITEASDAMAAYGAARLAFLGFNDLDHSEVLKPPTVNKIIEKDSNLNSLLKDRFNDWKNYYIN